MQNNRKVGAEREKRTAALLERKGYRILEKNFRCRSGEIDIIASHKEYLVFVEVKYRRNAGKGFAGEAVNYRKMQSICRTADYYMVTL